METIKLVPQTNGGRAIITAKELLEKNRKTNRFLVMCILKGLGLEVNFVSMSKVKFKEGTETVNNIRSSFVSVSVV